MDNSLSAKAWELLKSGAANGTIIVRRSSQGGLGVSAGNINSHVTDRREVTAWESALDELVENDLIIPKKG
jgi:hypothetical protein